jgi:hypothetical protein
MVDYTGVRKFLEEKTGLAKFNAGKTNIVTYCPWCETGSRKNHGHLYLECVSNPKQMPVFHCFKCEDKNPSKGTLVKLLRILGADPRDYITEETLSSKFTGREYDYHNRNLDICKHRITDQNFDGYKLKKQYLHARLGFDFDLKRIPRLVLNVQRFVNENNIDLGKNKRFLEYYEKSFIGFVSDYGTILVLRNIDSNSPYRYVKIPLTENKNFFKDMYSIKNGQTRNNNNTIVLCEGIFDLLVAMNAFELQGLKIGSCLWAATLGCGYRNVIPSVLDRCKLTSSNFVILSDADKKERFYCKFSENPSIINFEVYWNKFGKDFGKLPISITKRVFKNGRW